MQAVGTRKVYVPPLTVASGDFFHWERGGPEGVVYLVAYFKGVERDSRGYYRAGGGGVDVAGAPHGEDALFDYSRDGAAPTGVYGGNGAARFVAE